MKKPASSLSASRLLPVVVIGCLLALPSAVRVSAATFGWSGSGSGGGSGAGTAWLTAGNWTNNAGTPTNIDIAVFGTAGTASGIGFNFNAPPINSTNIGAIVLRNGLSRSLGNSSTTAGIMTRMYHFGVGGGLFTNSLANSNLTFQPFASGGSGHGMTNVIMAAGNIEAVGNITFLSQLTDAGTARNITKSGNGQLVLATNNAYLGTFTVNAGGITIKNSGSLGTGTKTISIANGTAGHTHMILDNTGNGADINVASSISFNTSHAAGTITNTAGNNTIQGAINLTGGGGDTLIRVNGGSLTLSGVISSAFDGLRTLILGGASSGTISGRVTNGTAAARVVGLTKQDGGTWTLNSYNGYTGNTLVSGGTLTLGANGAISNSPLITVNSGATFNVAAVSGGFRLMSGQALAGGGTVAGPVTIDPGAAVLPGGSLGVGTLTFNNNLTLSSGSVLNFDLGTDPRANGSSNDLIAVSGSLTLNGTIPVTFSFPLGAPTFNVPYVLAIYGALNGSAANFQVVGLSGYYATIDTTSVPGKILVTFVEGIPNDIVWTGTNGFNWDLATTINFTNANGTEMSFSQGDNVLFDDSSTNQTVTLIGNGLQPTAVTVNSSSNFTFGGSGSLAGGTITKDGIGTLTINNANTTPRSVTIQGGVLKTGNGSALGTAVGGTTISGSGTLDVNGQNLGAEAVTVSGAGYTNGGAIVNYGGGQQNALRFVTLTGDTTFGGNNRWDIRGNPTATLSSGGQSFNITKVGTLANYVPLVAVTVDPALGDIDVQSGGFGYETTTTSLGDPTKTLNIWSNAYFLMYQATFPLNKKITIQDGGTNRVDSGNNTNLGPITLVGGFGNFDIRSPLAVLSTIDGPGSLIKVGSSFLILSGANTYSGGTLVAAGLLQGTTDGLQGFITNNSAVIVNQDFNGTLNATVTGTGHFTKRGLGRLTIDTPLAITGTVTNEAGTIVLGADNVFGFGLQDWRGAGGLFPAFESSDATARTITNTISISTDTRLGSATSGDLIFSGPINNGGAQKILTVSNAVTTFSSGFGNTGIIVKDGPGQIVMGGANNNNALVISNGTMTLIAGGYFSNNPSMTIRPGGVLDVSAGSGSTFTNANGKTFIAGRTSGFANDLVGNLESTGTVILAAANVPATFSLSGDMQVGGGTLNFDLANATTTGAGVNDFINVGGAVTLAGTITVNVNLMNGSLANGTYTLITGTSPVAGTPTFTLTGTNGNTRQTAAVSISGNSVVLNVTGDGPAPLAWLGTAGNNWDVNSSLNWSNFLNGLTGEKFFNYDAVYFDDMAANTNVQITTTVSPSSVTVNSSSNFTFGGAGLIAGGTGLAKSGTGTLTLGNANTFFGPVSISGGTVKQGNAGALGASSGINITAGGGFDFAGFTTTSKALSFSIAGTGADGYGAIKNTGGNVSGSSISNVTLTADATIGSHGTDGTGGRMDIGTGYGLLNGNGFKLTKNGPGYLDIRSFTIDLPEILVAGGTLYTENIDNNLGAKVTVYPNARLGGTGLRTYTNQVDLMAGSTFFTAVANTPSTWSGPINVLGPVFFGAATISGGSGAQDLRLTGSLNGSGNIVLSVAPLELTANNDATYSGNIAVNGTTLRMTTNGTHGTGLLTNNNGTIEFNVFANLAYDRNIYGPAGTVRKANTNLFQLAGASGDQISDALVLDVTGGIFDLNGRSEGLRGLSGSAGTIFTNSGSLATLTLTNPTAGYTYLGNIVGPITVLVRDSSAKNTGVQVFSADGTATQVNTNSFTGGLVIDNGHARAAYDYQLGAVPGAFDPANIIVRNSGALQNYNSYLEIHPNRGILLESGEAAFACGWSKDIIINSVISGPGKLLKGDGGRLILKSANLFTGDTVFTNFQGQGAGAIRLDHSLALQNSTFDATGLGANGTLDLNNLDVVLGMIKGGGATIANFNGQLTVGGNGQNGIFSSTLAGAGRLNKIGPGILALTAGNSYNGGTIVNEGTLIALGNLSGFGPIVVKAGATFGSPATVSGPMTVEAGGSVYPGASVATLTVNNNLAIDSGVLLYELGNGNIIGSGANDLINVQSNLTLSGTTQIRFSFVNGAPALGVPYTLIAYSGTLSGSAANLTSDSRYAAAFDTSVPGQIRVTFSGSGGSNLVWTGNAANNVWDRNGVTNWFNGVDLDIFKDGDIVTFNDSGYAAAPVRLDGVLSAVSVTVNSAQDYTFAGLGRINTAGTLAKQGAGTLTLANTNEYIGAFNIAGGTMSVAREEFLGQPPVTAVAQLLLPGGTFQAAGSFNLNANRRIVIGPTNSTGFGAIEVTGTNTLTYAGLIGNNQFGVGSLLKLGSGTLALGSANTYSGGTVISKGSVLVRNDSALGTIGAITLGDAATGSDSVNLLLDVIGSGGNRTLARDIAISSAGTGPVVLGTTPAPLAPGTANGVFSGAITMTNHDLVMRSGAGDYTRFTGPLAGTGNIIITNGSLTGDMRGNGGNRIMWDGTRKKFTGDILILGGSVTPLYTNFTVLQIGAGSGSEFVPDTTSITVQSNAVLRMFAHDTINGLSGQGRVRGVVNQYVLAVGAAGASSTFDGVMENDPFDAGSLALTKVGAGTLTLNGINTYTGPTIIGAGTLALGAGGSLSNSVALTVTNGALFDVSAIAGGWVLMGNQTLNGFGTVLGSVTLASNATVNPGLLNAVGTLSVSGNLGIANSNRFNFELGSNPDGPGNDLVTVSGDLNISGVSYITVSAVAPLSAGTYTLITSAGTKSSLGGAANFILINNTASAMFLSETANAITLTVTTAGRSLVWAGNSTNGLWDINVTTNWLNGGVLDKFLAGDGVTFDSTAAQQNVTNNSTILASTVTFTGTTNYFVTGSGKISGAASIIQNSASTNLLGMANDYSGSVTINGGVLKANNAAALGNSVGATIINGGSLDVNALNLGAEQFVVQGTGWQNQGAIVNSAGGQNNATRFVTLAGDTTFGGTGRWDIRANPTAYLSSGGQSYKLTKAGANQVSIVDAVVDPALGDIEILGGILGFEVNSTAGDPTWSLSIGSGATLQFWNINQPFNKPMFMTNGARLNNGSGANAVISPITLLGSNAFDVAGTSLALSNTIDGAGSLWKVGGTATLLLAGNNTYSGGTVLQTGTTILTGDNPNSGGVSNNATLQIGNSGLTGSLGGLITNNNTLNLLRSDATTPGFAVIGSGTINQSSGSGPVTFNGGISNGTLRLLSGNNSALTLGAGNYAFNAVAVGPNPSGWMSIQPGVGLFANQIFLGEANGFTGAVAQVGGDVWITNQFRVGHWPNNVSTYLLGGGTINMTTTSATTPAGAGEQNGGFYIGIDGVGIFTQTNGTLNVPGIVLDNRGATTLGLNTNTYILNGGTLNLGRWGLLANNATYQVRLGGGLITSSESWTSALTMTLTGTNGDTTVSPAAGLTNEFAGALAGSGGLIKTGAGAVSLAAANSYAGSLAVNNGTLIARAMFNGNNSALGLRLGSRNVLVGPAGTLLMTINNVLTGGGNSAVNLPVITVDGGVLDSTRFNAIGHLNLNGALLAQTASDGPGAYEGWQFLGAINVGGASASTMSSGNGRGNHLLGGATNVFDVADATGDSSADLTVSNPLLDGSGDYSGAGSLLKLGAGTLRLNAANTYTGTTYANGGILVVDGSLASGPVIVDGATLSGTGTIGGAVTVAPTGTLSPGASIGTLTINSTLDLAGNTVMEINKAAGPALTSDRVIGVTTLTYGGALTVTLTGDPLAEGDVFDLFDAATFVGGFASVSLPPLTPPLAWDLSQLAVSGVIRVSTAPIITADPLPQTLECPASTATFSVTAAGSFLGYQWRSNSVPLPGANGATLVLNDLNFASTGNFDVIVANGVGSVTSAPAALIVQDTTPPTVACQNVTVTLEGPTVSITPAQVFDAGASSDSCGGTVTPVSVAPDTFACAGSYSVTLSATDGNGNTNTCTATVTVVRAAVAGVLSYEPFTCYAAGSLVGQTYLGSGYDAGSWYLGSGDATNLPAGSLLYTSGAASLQNEGGRVATAAEGFNTVFANLDTNSAGAFSNLVDAALIGGPNASGTLYFSFLARNASGNLDGGADFAGLELYNDGTEVLGIGNNWNAWAYSLFGVSGDVDLTNNSAAYLNMDANVHLFVARIDYVAAGDDTITVWMDPDLSVDENSQGDLYRRTFTGNAAFNRFALRSGSDNNDNSWQFDEIRFGTNWTVVTPAAPAIQTQPTNIIAGCSVPSATFSVFAQGTPPLAYQWRSNGVDIAGANAASYVILAPNPGASGSFDVVITNVFGSVTSVVATLALVDTVAPDVTCPPAVGVQCLGDVPMPNTALVTATDACDPAPVVFYAGDTTNGVCPIIITRVYGAYDSAGNTNTCTQIITVQDITPPTITCPANVAVNCLADVPAADFAGGSVSDNCDPAPVVSVLSETSVGVNPIVITRVYVAADVCGNTNTCTQIITVQDNVAPIIATAPNITTTNDLGVCGAVVNFTAPAATDNCGTPVVGCLPASGSTFAVGSTIVTCTATDAAGNTNASTFIVTVNDVEAPAIAKLPSIAVENEEGLCSAVVTFTAPSASDNCAGVNVACVPASGSTFDVGTTTVTCTATDLAGNTNASTFTVTVNDVQAPTIATASDIATTNDLGLCSAVVTFTAPAASDNCSGVTVACVPASGSAFSVGTTTVTCTATDAAGNTNASTFIVTVNDTQIPVVVWSFTNLVLAANANCQAIMPDVTGTNYLIVSDNCASSLVVTQSIATNTLLALGTNEVVLGVADPSGNVAYSTNWVIVADQTPPVITQCLPLQLLVANASCEAVLPDLTGEITATDACGAITITQSPAPGTAIGLGLRAVVMTAKDGAGNTATCTGMVIVYDATAPVITACASNRVIAAGTNCQTALPNIAAEVVAADNCDPNLTYSQSPAAGTMLGLGTYTVTLYVADGSGNTNSCQATVTIADLTPPVVVSCPANQTVSVDSNTCLATIPDLTTNAVAVDNCSAVTITQQPPAGTLIGVGTTNIVLRFTDAANNESSCSVVYTATEPGGAPSLSVLRAGSSVTVSWPETCADWKLQQAYYFSANTLWFSVTNAPVKVDNRWEVTLPASGLTRFYQLKRSQP